MSGIAWQPCGHCDGAGRVTGLLDEPYTCGDCGGHGRRPADDSQGIAWYYRPRGKWATEQIALLQPDMDDPARWRVTKWDKRGPVTHYIERADRIMYELDGYRLAAGAGRLLDNWAGRPEWARGLQGMAFNAYLAVFSYHDRLELGQEINRIACDRGLEAAIKRGEELRRQELPDVAIFG